MRKIIHLFFEDDRQDNRENLLRVVDGLANSQQASGEIVEVWTISSSPNYTRNEKTFVARTFLPHWSRFNLNTQLIHEIETLPTASLFHFHGGFVPEFHAIVNILKSKDIPYVVSPYNSHSRKYAGKRAWKKVFHFDHIEAYWMHNAVFIHCETEEEISNIQKMGDFERFRLIPQGHDIASFQMGDESVPSQAPIYGFCGSTLRHQNSLGLLLNAFRLYKCDLQGKGKLWLIAEEENDDYLMWSESMCEIREDVSFFGEREVSEKRHLMSQLDAFYQTSPHEEPTYHLLEAAAMGKAVVVSEHTNMTPYVSAYMAGICLLKNTPEEIAKSMKKVADLKKIGLLGKLGTCARRMVEDHFDWKIIGRRMLDAYAL